MRQFKISERYTLRNSENLNRYISEVSKYDIMSPEEEFRVALAASEGDPVAKEKLIRSNLRFVISVAKMYGHRDTETLNDLINEGNMGVIEAADGFDPTTGFKFISYAVWFIRKNMTKYLTDNGRTVRLPQNKVTAIHQMRDIESKLANELDRDPTSDEVVERFAEVSPELLKLKDSTGTEAAIKMAFETGSTVPLEGNSDDPEKDFGPINFINGDINGVEDLIKSRDTDIVLSILLASLNSREREIIVKRFGIGGIHPESRESLAERFEVSAETIRGWEGKIIRKLSELSNKTGLSREMMH